MISIVGIIALRGWKEARTEELRGVKIAKIRALKKSSRPFDRITGPSQKPLNPVKQSSKKIGDEEGVGEDQCPTDHPFKVDLNLSSLSRCVNSKNFFANHL